MVRIVLPTDNGWLNTYFNTKEADATKVRKHELERVIELSEGKVEDYYIEFEKRSEGQYFIIENDKERKWITVSADFSMSEFDGGSTNTYFVQYIPMAFRDMFESDTSKEKKLEIYLKGTSHNRATTEAQILNYRMANSIGIKILNINELNRVGINIQKIVQKKIETIDEWQSEKLRIQNKNGSNKPSYLLENKESYIFYGKTFGANGRESIFILYFLALLAKKENKKIYLYEVEENGTNAFESAMNPEDRRFKKMLESYGIIYYLDSVSYVDNEKKDEINEKEKEARNQAEFMRNLMIKYNAERDESGAIKRNKKGNPIINNTIKKCYLCNCTIQKLIIASHIQRVSDIKKLGISFKQKRLKAVDGENGFWLCANHDKMFEYGIITFNEENGLLQINKENLDDFQRQFINSITNNTNVEEIHFTDELKEYLKKHNDRIKEEIKNYNYTNIDIYKEEELLNVAEEPEDYKKDDS